jgi:hypothetical protein
VAGGQFELAVDDGSGEYAALIGTAEKIYYRRGGESVIDPGTTDPDAQAELAARELARVGDAGGGGGGGAIGAVRYDVAQALTTAQQERAQQNMDLNTEDFALIYATAKL